MTIEDGQTWPEWTKFFTTHTLKKIDLIICTSLKTQIIVSPDEACVKTLKSP